MQRDTKHVLSHTAIYLVARGLPGVIAFLATPLFTRLLDPAGFGRYSLVLATVVLANALLFQWLRLALVRYLPAYGDEPVRLKSTLVTAAAALIFAAGPLAIGACLLVPGARQFLPVALPCWGMLAVQAVFELCCEFARAALRPWHYMTMQVVRSAAMVGVGAALIRLGAGWWGPLAGAGVGMALAVALVWRRDWGDVRLAIDRETLTKVCHYGIPLSLTVALATVIGSSDRFLIAWYMGEGAAGLYSAAADFTGQTLTLLMMVVYLAAFPIAVRAWEQQGRAAAQDRMRSNASLLLAVGVPCVIGLALLAPGIAHCFLGAGFRSASGIMPMVALGTFLAGFKAYHFDAAFQFAHRTVHQVWIVLIAAVANIVLNLALIPSMGINGAALASVLAYVLSLGLTASVGRRYFVLPVPVRATCQVLLAGAVMGLVLLPFRDRQGVFALACQIAGGAALYGAVLMATNFLGLREHAVRAYRTRRQETAAAVEPGGEPVPAAIMEEAAAVTAA
jgi:O-antigen/teichoic acid export membrane protein